MTVISNSVAFWAPVTFARVGDNHKPEIIQFRARFKRLKKTPRLELDRRLNVSALTTELRKAMQARIDDPDITEKERQNIRLQLQAKLITDEEFLNEICVDWELKDREGGFIAYSIKERKEQDEELDGLETAMVQAYFKAKTESLTPEAIAKNSGGPFSTSS